MNIIYYFFQLFFDVIICIDKLSLMDMVLCILEFFKINGIINQLMNFKFVLQLFSLQVFIIFIINNFIFIFFLYYLVKGYYIVLFQNFI